MWQMAANISSGFALAAFIGLIALYAYRYSLRKQERLLNALPEADRLKAVDRVLGRFHVDTANLTKQQKFDLAIQQIHTNRGKTEIIAIVIIVIAALAAAVLIVALTRDSGKDPQANDREAPPARTSLNLRLEEDPQDVSEADGPHQGLGEQVAFTLSNPLKGLALIDSVSLEVLESFEHRQGTSQAVVRPYKYKVSLSPKDVGQKVGIVNRTFKYAPGEVDRFLVSVESKQDGLDYIARIVVRWRDDIDGTANVTTSDLIALRYPGFVPNLTRDDAGRLDEQHEAKLRERMGAVRQALQKPSE